MNGSGGDRSRRLLARFLVVAASIALVLALVAGYAKRAVMDSDQFANRATAALESDSVRSLLAQRITDDLVLEQAGDLIAARPVIESVASGVVGGRAFTGLFRRAVRDVHAALFDREQSTLTLTVADVGTLVAAALQRLEPSVAARVESAPEVDLVTRNIGDASTTLAATADRTRHLALILALLWLALVAAAIAVSPDRRRTVVELGIGAAAGGIALVVAYGVLRSVALGGIGDPDSRAAAAAVWDAFLGDLRIALLILAVAGVVVAAAAASLIRPRPLGEPLRAVYRRLATEPRRPALRVLRGIGFVAVGVLVIAARDVIVSLAVTLLGILLVYEGTSAILALVYRPAQAGEPRPRVSAPRRRRLAAVALPAVVIAGAIVAFTAAGGTTAPAPAAGPCNGHVELCERTLPEVALAATHNSMSAPLPGWYSSAQDAGVADQLREGIRGLLIDTHYADRLPNGRLRTFVGDEEELRANAEQDGVNPDAVDAALRLRERLGFAGEGERGMYLCHSFCELGGTELSAVLDDIHDFLVANPGEVLVVVNQDYLTPEDFVGAVRAAGLEDLAYRGPVEGRWPTLGEMVERDQRLVLLAENEAGAAPWYRPAYDRIVQETPYSFGGIEQLIGADNLAASCEPNRGPGGAPLFLVNHWITTDPLPLPSHADRVNAYQPLLDRLRTCRRDRGRFPNLVAVNFYRRGDLLRVVDTLNGVDRLR